MPGIVSVCAGAVTATGGLAGAGRGAGGAGCFGAIALGMAGRGGGPAGGVDAGKGCRGPERICPGLGDGGTGLAGMPAPRKGG